MATLYIVSTPIGNLADISYRAIEVLRAVRRVLAEDTRRTNILFKHYGITTPLISAHEHNEAARAGQILEWLSAGDDLALVSDAGTPLLSDPGARIVQQVLAAGHEVVPIPGASALLAALVASGLPAEPFTFFGFVPRSGRERSTRLEQIARLVHTAVLYEAPSRLVRLLQDLNRVCGADRNVVVTRELTKVHETFVRGTLAEMLSYYEGEQVRGEVVVLVAGAAQAEPADREAEALSIARTLLEQGASPRDAAQEITRRLGIARNRAYEIAQNARSRERAV